jgi:hypothetical protein
MSMLETIIESSGQIPKCPIGRFKYEHADIASELEEALTTKGPDGAFVVSGAEIARYLTTTFDIRISAPSVRNHRREGCACT